MQIGKYEDRISIEAKNRILRLYVDMKRQYNPYDSITDYGARQTEKRFIKGFIDGINKALEELKELER